MIKESLLNYCGRLSIDVCPDPLLITKNVKLMDLYQPSSAFHIDLVESAAEGVRIKRESGYKHRVVLSGPAGSGKSSFVKALVISFINNDDSFFETCNDLLYTIVPDGEIPILLQLNKLSETVEDLKEKSLAEICFDIAKKSYLEDIDISFNEFESYFNKATLLCVDAYDEILSLEKEKLIRQKLEGLFDTKNIVLTSREDKLKDFEDEYEIQHMPKYSNEDVREFIKKYYKAWGYPDARAEAVIKQIESPRLAFTKDFRYTPMMLSLLLCAFESSGSYLPTNRLYLVEEMVNRYFHLYSQKRRENSLKPQTLTMFLRYICLNMLMFEDELSKEEAFNVIDTCKVEKDGCFEDNVYNRDAEIIYDELIATGFIEEYDEGLVSFALHRLFAEYFAGIALIDFKFFKEKAATVKFNKTYDNVNHFLKFNICFDLNRWKMPIIFYLMKHKFKAKKFIRELLAEPYVDGFKFGNELELFALDLIVHNVDMDADIRCQIYDSNFKNIDFKEKKKISEILSLDNNVSKDFVSYIENQARQSFLNESTDFVDALTMVYLNKDHPFDYIKELFSNVDDDFSIYMASRMLIELKKIKEDSFMDDRENVNEFIMNPDCIYNIIQIYKSSSNQYLLKELTKSLFVACVSEIISFSDVFSDDNFVYLISELNEGGKNAKHFEKLLEAADVNKIIYYTSVTKSVKKRFLNEYEEKISNRELNSIYSFVKCVRTGCFNQENFSYSDFCKLKDIVYKQLRNRLSIDDFPGGKSCQELLLSRLKKELLFKKFCEVNGNTYEAWFKDVELAYFQEEIESLFSADKSEAYVCNGLCNLLRQGHIERVTKNGEIITEKELVKFASDVEKALSSCGLNHNFYTWMKDIHIDFNGGGSSYYERYAKEQSRRMVVFFEKIEEAYKYLLNEEFILNEETAFSNISSLSRVNNNEYDFEKFVILILQWKLDPLIFEKYCAYSESNSFEDDADFTDLAELIRDFFESGLAHEDVFWPVFSALYTAHLKKYCKERLKERPADDTIRFKEVDGIVYEAINDYRYHFGLDYVIYSNPEGGFLLSYFEEDSDEEKLAVELSEFRSVLYSIYVSDEII